MRNVVSKMRSKKDGKKGFTLMEMLIVVAIIAILVVISIPVFSSQLSSAKKAADDANLRAAKAVATTMYLAQTNDPTVTNKIEDGMIYDADKGTFVKTTVTPAPKKYGQMTDHKDKYIVVSVDDVNSKVEVDWQP